ncbi:SDR family NAD(P)-dependent oxidoreductase [Arthrobacter ramosus]|uniref:SDR family NAD(P)-dependent oxidoreductase n=1 Tax=Arthrobacter ramosus TaxID=1672 RepID=A0ABV5XXE7_ARTRM|nr:SDR family NAD(P)-dependent oxidoreductase [Arthrobacter ramosus]
MTKTTAGLLTGRRVVLTGAAANIGAAIADRFGEEGASIVIGDIDTGAQGTVDRLRDQGVQALFVRTDVSDAASMENLFHEAASFLGGIDVIVNNAGVQRSAPITELAESDWDLHMAVNAKSCFLAAKYGIPFLRNSPGDKSIVNMASAGGIKAPPGLTGYSASKGAIIAFTKTLAGELGHEGVRVNCVAPGWIDTSFNDPVVAHMGGRDAQAKSIEASVPLRRQGTPDEVAEAFLFLASNASTFVTGQTLIVDGGSS